ncbi:hypothetical protein [Plantibacter sp. Leaf314]|uniref:hypothetical protein n=1 Tax=Plantibacter sp. Leaf314 TaxID=1736333 RepID=UPI000B27F5BB|nr:hypothetical protein [Plantibacter sp. Leaf314]
MSRGVGQPTVVPGCVAYAYQDEPIPEVMVLQYSIAIGRASYDIDPAVDVQELMTEIESAVQAGGRFVRVPLTSDRAVNVLVSPGLLISVESFAHRALEIVPSLEAEPLSGLDEYDEFDEF